MRKEQSAYLNPATKEFAELAYAVSVVYPWVTFPIEIQEFANDVFRHMIPDDKLRETAHTHTGVLAHFLDWYFYTKARAYEGLAGRGVKLHAPENPGTLGRVYKRLQAARDRTLTQCP